MTMVAALHEYCTQVIGDRGKLAHNGCVISLYYRSGSGRDLQWHWGCDLILREETLACHNRHDLVAAGPDAPIRRHPLSHPDFLDHLRDYLESTLAESSRRT